MSVDSQDRETQARRLSIAGVLLKMRGDGMDWGQPYKSDGALWSKKVANRFLLCCLLDYQIPSLQAWANGERLVISILGDPDDIWREITSVPEHEWKSKRGEYRLHRFPVAHDRLWRIGRRVCDAFEGDARRIWDGRDPVTTLEVLWGIGAGDQISRMIVGALRDCGQIKGLASDVKGDVYVRRVLGRALLGAPTDAETAVALARQLHPADPWLLDGPLWVVGQGFCKTIPKCPACELAAYCIHALASSAELPKGLSTG